MRKLLITAFAAIWLLLLGLCVYFAAQLGYVNLPFITSGRSPTPVATGIVPNLLGEDYATSREVVQKAGFTIRLVGGSTPPATYIVIQQNPLAGSALLKGSAIEIQMGLQSTRVPNGLVNTTLVSSEAILFNAGLNFRVVADGTNSKVGHNIVSRTDPPSGTSLEVGSTLVLYVVNYHSGNILAQDIRYTSWHSDMAEDSFCRDKLTCVAEI